MQDLIDAYRQIEKPTEDKADLLPVFYGVIYANTVEDGRKKADRLLQQQLMYAMISCGLLWNLERKRTK